jgi:hypothetical protein
MARGIRPLKQRKAEIVKPAEIRIPKPSSGAARAHSSRLLLHHRDLFDLLRHNFFRLGGWTKHKLFYLVMLVRVVKP